MSEDADRRTLPPTPKRVQEFRDRGEVARSRDLTAAATLAGGAIAGLMWAPRSLGTLEDVVRSSFGGLGRTSAGAALANAGAALISTALPVLIGGLGGCTLAMAAQLGFPLPLVAPKFDFSRLLSPGSLGQLFSPKAAAGRVLTAIAKVAFVGFAAGLAIASSRELFAADGDARLVGPRLAGTIARLVVYAGGALALLAALDYVLARRRMAAQLRMTPEEMKRERRDSDGDPQVRARRRRRMREISKRRVAHEVKRADVVLVNPTEYAVALRYRADEDRAPRVVAKGRGDEAEYIRDLARSAGVPIVPSPPLTRLLHKTVPEGREIPSTLFQAVAEVLAYVYRLQGRK